VDPLATIGNAAAVGAFAGATLALLFGRDDEAPEWAIRGSVCGGAIGVALVIWNL
jgi:hypothetical protein